MDRVTPGTIEDFIDAFGDKAAEVTAIVADYLDAGTLFLANLSIDHPARWKTDGRYIWSGAAAASVRSGDAVVEVEFARHVLENRDKPPVVLNDEMIAAAMFALP